MTSPGRTSPRIWLAALVATLLLHLGALVGLVVLRPFEPTPVEARPPDPIELVFAADPLPETDEPSFFTEQPEDRASERPEEAEALSNVDATAADPIPGGEDARPRTEGTNDVPSLALNPGSPEPETEPVPSEATSPEETPPVGGLEPVETPPPAPSTPSTPERRRDPLEGLLRRSERPPTPAGQESLQPGTGQDTFLQEARDAAGSSTPSMGEFTLSTYAWEYAPWLEAFRRDFYAIWHAPLAYYAGLIHGWHIVTVAIGRDGTMLSLETGDIEGDKSLQDASVATFRAAAPYRPLPDTFPDETLVLTVRLRYPELRRR